MPRPPKLASFAVPEDFLALEDVRVELVAGGYLKQPPGYPPEAAAGWLAKHKSGGGGASPAGRAKKAAAGGAQKLGKGGASQGSAAAKAKPSSGGKAGGSGTAPSGKGAVAREARESAASTRAYLSPSGLPILLGRNNRGNEHVSHTYGRPGDVWMHVQGAPGCHLVLSLARASGAGAATDEDLRYAANLCAYFSSLRGSTVVPVTVTDPKHLKRPRGGRPGMVTIGPGHESVVWGRPADSAAAAQGEEDG